MSGRCAPLKDPVTITLDGESIEAERGEPISAALIAAGKLALARSPKFHRPRGPSCMRAACDGCLARVDDVPNVMTCMVPVREGTEVHSQNTLGSRDVDLLRVTDWFFPQGMDHHELFAGVPGIQNVMQAFARRVAGLGRVPTKGAAARPAQRREVDVMVIGAGPAGMATATRIAERGRRVEVVDDALDAGGGMRALGAEDRRGWSAIESAFAAAVEGGRVVLRSSTTACGFYGDDLLVAGPSGAEVVTARAFVIAAGAHDGVLAFEGNDVPGVMSARAAGVLLARGVVVGKRVVVATSDGGGPFGEAYARSVAASHACEVTLVHGEIVKVSGSSRVTGVTVRDSLRDGRRGEKGRERKLKADALLVDAPRAPAYELCEQAGASLVHEPRGFVAQTVLGKVRDGVWAVGEVVGTPFDPTVTAEAAAIIALQL